jgi:hypothetical protein
MSVQLPGMLVKPHTYHDVLVDLHQIEPEHQTHIDELLDTHGLNPGDGFPDEMVFRNFLENLNINLHRDGDTLEFQNDKGEHQEEYRDQE